MAGLATPICEAIGIEYPVFQAGMGFIARSALAAAVSEAGGLGVIGAGSNLSPEELREEILATKALTDKPFGVDILFGTIRAEGEAVARYTDAVQGMVDVVLEERRMRRTIEAALARVAERRELLLESRVHAPGLEGVVEFLQHRRRE